MRIAQIARVSSSRALCRVRGRVAFGFSLAAPAGQRRSDANPHNRHAPLRALAVIGAAMPAADQRGAGAAARCGVPATQSAKNSCF